jgi:hypothetical protein
MGCQRELLQHSILIETFFLYTILAFFSQDMSDGFLPHLLDLGAMIRLISKNENLSALGLD